jgi:amino acid transporter
VFFGRLFGDGLLAYIIYAFLFVGVFNSATNAQQIGRELLISISPNQDPNRHLVRFIGIVAFSIICLIQLFSSRAGRSINSTFALIKILFLLVLLGFGFAAICRNTNPVEFTQKVSGIPALNYAQAILAVLFSYAGWENANFVSTTPVPECSFRPIDLN